MAEEGELKEWGFEAVRGATEWLVGLRRSADLEGFDPYGDGLTDYDSGFVSVSEGLTTLSLVKAYEREHGVDLGAGRLSEDLYRRDIEWLLTEIEEDRYRGTPYLDAEDTDNFTDGVSFSTSVLMEALELPGGDLSEDRILSALEKNLKWFLENPHNHYLGDGEGDPPHDSTLELHGWSWCGYQEMVKREDFYPPQTYFTWSACIALSDFLGLVDRFDEDYEEQIIGTLEKAKGFLIQEYRVEPGWIEFEPAGGLEPEGYEAIDPSPSLLSTCYTIWALCYMQNRVPGVELTEEERNLIERSMTEYVLGRLEDNVESVYAHSTRYRCKRDGNDYYEGSAPYAILNTLIEFADAFEQDREKIESLERDLVEQILTKCWGGSRGGRESREAGFRHFENPQKLESPDNPTVVYATEIAVESLLYYGIEAPDTPSVETKIIEELRRAEKEILEVVQQAPSSATTGVPSGADVAQVEELNKNLLTRSQRLSNALGRQFTSQWKEISRKLPGEVTEKIANSPVAAKDTHVSQFLETVLDRCYFEGDPEMFTSTIEKFKQDWEGYILLPYRDALDELEQLDPGTVRDPIARKQAINDVLGRLEEDITLGYSTAEMAEDLRASIN